MMIEALDHGGPEQQLRPYFLALLAEGELAAGSHEEAGRRIDLALACAEETGEGFFLPYTHRVAAVVRAATGEAGRAARHRDLARDLAVEQDQVWNTWVLGAATSRSTETVAVTR